MTRAVQLSSETVEHYTPSYIVEPGRALMGAIDLDPASCAVANKVIRATRFYTSQDNGFCLPWTGRVFLNPPGGSIVPGARRSGNGQAAWWARLAHLWEMDQVEQAIFVVFNLELFRHCQGYPVWHPLRFPACFPKNRIPFLDTDLNPQKSPGHPSAIVWLHPKGLQSPKEHMASQYGDVGECV